MLALQLGLLLILLPVCSFAPGFYFVRKLRWSPMEKLCASVGLSLILLYLVCWAIYCASPRGVGMTVHAAPFAMVSLVCAAMAAACRKEMGRLARANSVRGALAGFAFLLIWTALLMAMIRNYSGGGWSRDWLEHFQRSLFFLGRFPAETTIEPTYTLPARPPMMNVLGAFFLAQTSDRFELFQAAFAFLNLLLFLPCCLLMPALGRHARRRTWLLVLLFATCPPVMQNTTYSWTKAMAAFYVVLALWFYLAGWRKRDRLRTTAAFVFLAAGFLAHYSAGPYVAIVALHYLAFVFPKRPRKWSELAGIAASGGLLLGTWLVWSVAVYGTELTFTSNTAVTYSQDYKGSAAPKMAGNLFDTVVPALARDRSLLQKFSQPSRSGGIRDTAFMFYQVNLIFGMGLAGGPLVLWLLYRAFRRGAWAAPESRFWLMLVAGSVLLGVAVVGERDHFGSAHLTLFAMQVVGLSMLASVVPWRRPVAMMLLAGCAVDFSVGVLLQARVESRENSARVTVFQGMNVEDGGFKMAAPGPDGLSQDAWSNWYYKHQLALLVRTAHEYSDRHSQDPAFASILPRMTGEIERVRASDADNWQGWFERHGGEVQLLGDHAAGGSDAATALLLMLFAGLVYRVLRNQPARARVQFSA